jgi:uncharacterized membrane protein YfcA
MAFFEWIMLLTAAFGAGFIDAVIGGGGLIQLPAVMFFIGEKELPVILGTNKVAGFAGTSIATIKYLFKTKILSTAVIPAILAAIPSAYLGAKAVNGIDKEILKPIIIFLFIAVAVYTFIKKDFGVAEPKKISTKKQIIFSASTGLLLGFYDGFFGPGTGSFLMFVYIVLFGFNFLQASAHAKLVNCVTNLAALSVFVVEGNINYFVAIPVAVFNIFGSILGTNLAIKKGSEFIRVFFMVVVIAFIVKMSIDLLF